MGLTCELKNRLISTCRSPHAWNIASQAVITRGGSPRGKRHAARWALLSAGLLAASLYTAAVVWVSAHLWPVDEFGAIDFVKNALALKLAFPFSPLVLAVSLLIYCWQRESNILRGWTTGAVKVLLGVFNVGVCLNWLLVMNIVF